MASLRSRFDARLNLAGNARARFGLLGVIVSAGLLGGYVARDVGSRRAGNSAGMAAGAAESRHASGAGLQSRSAVAGAKALSLAMSAPLGAARTDSTARDPSLPLLAETYLPEMLTVDRSRLKRWVERLDDPIRVWIVPGDSVAGFRRSFVDAARDAFLAWERSGVPVRFTFVDSSADAEVRVDWAERLPERRAGLTHWWTNAQGWLTRVNLVLAIQLSDDGQADDRSIHRMALHEIGHLLGLEHSPDADDIMSAWVNSNELSVRDRASARLLYSLPPGALAAGETAVGS